MIGFENGKITVTSNTPRNGGNREYRRRLLYGQRRQRLLAGVKTLRAEMIGAGIKVPSLPHQMSRKALSGYHGKLLTLARASA